MPEHAADGGASAHLEAGELRRFVLERYPVRAFWTRLDGPWRELCSLQQYPLPVERLLGEAVTASVLLAATLKFHGTLTLQLQGHGAVQLLVAQCTHDLRIRGLARIEAPIAEGAGFRELVGDSRLAVTIEADGPATRYQGIVQLEGDTLSACLENYFATSEQLPTRIALTADAQRARGLLTQKMPGARAGSDAREVEIAAERAWQDVQENLRALPLPLRLLQQASAEEILRRVGGAHDGRVFAGSAVQFACRCSPERVAGLLRSLGRTEIDEVLVERGAVTVTCEFCGRPYRFDPIDVGRLFAGEPSLPSPRSLN